MGETSKEKVDVLAIRACPWCGAEVEHGYGLAMGPGIGSYVYCVGSNDRVGDPSEGCGYSLKVEDEE